MNVLKGIYSGKVRISIRSLRPTQLKSYMEMIQVVWFLFSKCSYAYTPVNNTEKRKYSSYKTRCGEYHS